MKSEPAEADSNGATRVCPIRERLRMRWHRSAVWLELMRNLAVRDVEIRYKHSLLGLYWALINPLLTAGIYGFVFGVIFHAGSGKIPYVVFLFTGLTFWNIFANGIMSATTSVSSNASLVAKIYFPRVILPTAAVLARLIDFSFSVVVLVIVTAIFRTGVTVWILAVPLLVVVQLSMTLGLGYMTAALNVLYRDISQLIGLVLMVWLYLSPVMYAASSASPNLRRLLLLNPMGAILEAERDLIFLGYITDWPYLLAAVAWSALFFWVGRTVFRRIEPVFAEVL